MKIILAAIIFAISIIIAGPWLFFLLAPLWLVLVAPFFMLGSFLFNKKEKMQRVFPGRHKRQIKPQKFDMDIHSDHLYNRPLLRTTKKPQRKSNISKRG